MKYYFWKKKGYILAKILFPAIIFVDFSQFGILLGPSCSWQLDLAVLSPGKMKICPKHQSPALSQNWNTTGSVSETLKMIIN